MPLYAYTCAAGHTFQTFNRVKDRDIGPRCRCGQLSERNMNAEGCPAFGNKPWMGKAMEQTYESHAMVFQKEGVADIKKDCPSMEFRKDHIDPRLVRPVFKSDQHHRQCLKEINAARDRHEAGAATTTTKSRRARRK